MKRQFFGAIAALIAVSGCQSQEPKGSGGGPGSPDQRSFGRDHRHHRPGLSGPADPGPHRVGGSFPIHPVATPTLVALR